MDLLEQETVSGSGISRAICKSAPHPRQITMPASHHSVFTGRMPFLPSNQQRQTLKALGQSMLEDEDYIRGSELSFTAHMPLLMVTSTFRLGRR